MPCATDDQTRFVIGLDIAKLTGRRHDDVLRSIRKKVHKHKDYLTEYEDQRHIQHPLYRFPAALAAAFLRTFRCRRQVVVKQVDRDEAPNLQAKVAALHGQMQDAKLGTGTIHVEVVPRADGWMVDADMVRSRGPYELVTYLQAQWGASLWFDEDRELHYRGPLMTYEAVMELQSRAYELVGVLPDFFDFKGHDSSDPGSIESHDSANAVVTESHDSVDGVLDEEVTQPPTCPDGARCHHACGGLACYRRDAAFCPPLPGSGLDQFWNPKKEPIELREPPGWSSVPKLAVEPESLTAREHMDAIRTAEQPWGDLPAENLAQGYTEDRVANGDERDYQEFRRGVQWKDDYEEGVPMAADSKDLTTFIFPDTGFNFRVFMIGDEPWFVVVDVCKSLGIVNARDALRRIHQDDRSQVIDPNVVGSIDGKKVNDLMNVVNESGLYDLIMQSRRPEAKAFKRWITGTVLPALRKAAQGDPTAAVDLMASVMKTPEQIEAFIGALKEVHVARLAEAREREGRVLAERERDEERRQRQVAQAQVQEVMPHVHALDRIANLHGSITISDTAEKLGLSFPETEALLRQMGWVTRPGGYRDGPIQATVKGVRGGYMVAEMRQFLNPNTEKWEVDRYHRARVAPRGLTFLLQYQEVKPGANRRLPIEPDGWQ